LRFNSECWKKMEEAEKEFVLEYNAAIKHGDPTDKVNMPNGISVKNKIHGTKAKEETVKEAKPTFLHKCLSCLLQFFYKRHRLHGELQYISNMRPILIIRRVPGSIDQHMLIIDMGGGTSPTIMSNAWKVTHRYNSTMSISGYQSKDPPIN
jgi:hypothetical protein